MAGAFGNYSATMAANHTLPMHALAALPHHRMPSVPRRLPLCRCWARWRARWATTTRTWLPTRTSTGQRSAAAFVRGLGLEFNPYVTQVHSRVHRSLQLQWLGSCVGWPWSSICVHVTQVQALSSPRARQVQCRPHQSPAYLERGDCACAAHIIGPTTQGRTIMSEQAAPPSRALTPGVSAAAGPASRPA